MARRKTKELENKVEDLAPQKELPAKKPEPKAKAAAPKAKPLPLVKLRVFLATSGLKPDQSAGFVAHARIKKIGPMTIPQWKEELRKFFSRPVK